MADDSSNSVAIIAIVILVIAAIAGGYVFLNKQGTTSGGSTVKIEAPKITSKP